MRVRPHHGPAGFSILEMLIALSILLFGIVAVAQLIPLSIVLNYQSRTDSAALIVAQREIDQFLGQPLSSTSFIDADGNLCSLGDPTNPNPQQGSPVIKYPPVNPNQAIIDFTQATVLNYSFTSPHPTVPIDPTVASYDVRWAAIVMGNGTNASAKRFILGIRPQGGTGYFRPVTVDTMLWK
jgi:prepilin-type N-terminal cleavage/methylation domain-containing protein